MFTGIIEGVGTLRQIRADGKVIRLTVACRNILEGLKVGDSICTNGVCLTVVAYTTDAFECEVMKESCEVTNFKELTKGMKINLERALSVKGRFDGHIVQGHVDGIGKLMNKQDNVLRIRALPHILRYIVYKGSVALNGVSLTVSDVRASFFEVSIIPETLRSTTISTWRIGQSINIETDIFARYIENFVQGNNIMQEMMK